MYTPLLRSLRAGDSQPLSDWLRLRGVDTDDIRRLSRWDAAPQSEGVSSHRRPPDRWDEVTVKVSAQIPRTADAPGGVALLLLHVLAEVKDSWETSYHFSLLWDTLRAADACVRDCWTPVSPSEERAGHAVLCLMKALDAKIRAENAMTSGLPRAQIEAAESAVSHAGEAAELAAGLPEEYSAIRDFLLHAAKRDEIHNTAVSRAVGSITEFFRTGASLGPAMEALRTAERDDRLDRTRSSVLRTHRFSLAALERERQADWLRLDHGTVVWMYPFAVRGLEPERAVSHIKRKAGDWRFAGTGAVEVHTSLELDDRWDGSDSLGRRYDGAVVELPEVVVCGFDGTELERASAQIRFSVLGNHYVRFERRLLDVQPAAVYAAMFRAAPEHGAGRVAFLDAGGESRADTDADATAVWPRLSDLAVQLAMDAAEALRTAEEVDAVKAITRPGMFHVVVSVDAASVMTGPAGDAPSSRREVVTIEELTAAAGAQVLSNPVPHLMGGIAEWSQYSTRNAMSSAVMGMAQDWMLNTCNTTLLVGLGAPDFDMRGRGAMAEFAASLDGLFAGWFDELADHYRRVKGFRTRVNEAESGRMPDVPGALSELSRLLDDEKLCLDDFTVEAKSTMAFIRSPSLLSAPVDAHTMGMLLDNSGYPQRVEELTHRMEEVAHEQLSLTIEKIAHQRSEQRAREEARVERRRRAKLDSMLAVIAAIGISGLGQILQSGYTVDATGSMAIVVLIVLLAALVGTGFWLAARRGL